MLNPAIGSQESLKIDRREFCIDSLRYAAATMLGLYTGLECIRAVVEIADPSSEVVSHPGENEEMTIRAAHLYAENVMMSSHSAKQVGETALQAEVSADFEDDFTSLDTSKWYTCYPYSLEGAVDEGSDGSWNAGTAPLDGAVYDPFSIVSDSSATDGKLLRVSCRRTTAAEQADTGGKAWVGGIIISQEGWASGYLEWRARFPAAGSGTGMWPALWLFGQTQTSGDRYA
jgi:beta-glucanase (GH16 family)